jgi:hypothetical protein
MGGGDVVSRVNDIEWSCFGCCLVMAIDRNVYLSRLWSLFGDTVR